MATAPVTAVRHVSDEGMQRIRTFEACKLTAYPDVVKGIPTIGWGHTGADVHLGLTWTQEQADFTFLSDLSNFCASVENATAERLNDNQFEACVSLAFNIGAEAFVNSTVCRDISKTDWVGAAAGFALFDMSGGKVVDGLTKRRAAEAALFRTMPVPVVPPAAAPAPSTWAQDLWKWLTHNG